MTYRGAQNLIKRGDEAGLRAALDAGLDVNSVNQNGWTLLMLAAVEGDVPVGRLLVERGADVAAKNKAEKTAEMLAADRGFGQFVEMLNGSAAA
jgi:ankyrin repeat protein